MVNDQALDQLAHGNYALTAAADMDDGIDDGIIIGSLIHAVILLGDELLQNVGKIRRHGFADFRTGVLAGCALTDLNETVQGDAEPLVLVFGDFQDLVHFLARVVDQCGKGTLVLLGQGIAEYLVNLAAHGSGTVLQHVGERLVLTMDVGKKMFRSFREV